MINGPGLAARAVALAGRMGGPAAPALAQDRRFGAGVPRETRCRVTETAINARYRGHLRSGDRRDDLIDLAGQLEVLRGHPAG